MPARPDLTELERLRGRTMECERKTLAISPRCGECDSCLDFAAFNDALSALAAALLAEARKVETLTTEVAKLRADLRYLAEWDETKAAVLGSPDFRLIARAALEGASDEPRIDTCVECAAQVAALRGALRMAHLWLDLAAPDNVVLEVIAALEGEPDE